MPEDLTQWEQPASPDLISGLPVSEADRQSLVKSAAQREAPERAPPALRFACPSSGISQ